jgi:hypothetical protein
MAALVMIPSMESLTFECVFSRGNFEGENQLYICTATVRTEGDSMMLQTVRGVHQVGMNNSFVTGLVLSHQRAATRGFLPENIEHFFPNLLGMYLYHSVDELRRETLQPFGRLRTFTLRQGLIQVIPRRVFENNRDLRRLNFNNNGALLHVAHHIFDGLDLFAIHFTGSHFVNSGTHLQNGVAAVISAVVRGCPPTARMIVEEIMEEGGIAVDQDNLYRKINKLQVQVDDLAVQSKIMFDNLNFIMSRLFPQ